MEVLCERCQTEYDFDDALVSERGTTVKCTNCGHQFRIFRSKTVFAPPEKWVVQTEDGRDLVYTSLRDLQRAISRAQVHRSDTLTRGGLPSRRLSSIAELEPFFPDSDDGAAPVARINGGQQTATASESRPQVPSVQRKQGGEFNEETAPRRSAATDQELPPAQDLLGEEPAFEPASPPHRVASERDEAPRQAGGAIRAPDKIVIRDVPMQMTPTPSDVRASYGSMDDSLTDPRFLSAALPKRSAAARWVVGVVVVGALGVVAATVGQSYLMGAAKPDEPISAPDPRVASLLEEGKRLLREGDIEAAKAAFDKASVLAESDPHVLSHLARLTNIRTDQAWLKLRLLDPEQQEVIRVTRSELDARAKRALAASDRALKANKSDAVSARIRVDALRLAGDLSNARSLVPRLAEHTSEAEYAYVLAALEMCERDPNWQTVVDRLRIAAVGEQDLGRARAALVYALARSGQIETARTELSLLDKLPRPYPLIAEIKAFVNRMDGVARDGGFPSVGGASANVLDPTALPAAGQGDGDQLPAAGGDVPRGSYQQLLKQAHTARAAGNLDAAERFYKAVLAKNPGDAEALAGLGDIAKARGNRNASIGYYEEVSKRNPGYLPAMMGLADAKWESGDHPGAVALYQNVLSATGGQGPYAERARHRIAEASKHSRNSEDAGAAPSDPAGTSKEAPPPPTVPTTEPPPEPTKDRDDPATPPGVDTSDLPGWSP